MGIESHMSGELSHVGWIRGQENDIFNFFFPLKRFSHWKINSSFTLIRISFQIQQNAFNSPILSCKQKFNKTYFYRFYRQTIDKSIDVLTVLNMTLFRFAAAKFGVANK